MRTWARNAAKWAQGASGSAPVRETTWQLKTRVDAAEKRMRELRGRGGYEDAVGYQWQDMKMRDEYKALKAQVEDVPANWTRFVVVARAD